MSLVHMSDTQFTLMCIFTYLVSCMWLCCFSHSFSREDYDYGSVYLFCIAFEVTTGYCFRFLLSMPLEERFKKALCEVCSYSVKICTFCNYAVFAVDLLVCCVCIPSLFFFFFGFWGRDVVYYCFFIFFFIIGHVGSYTGIDYCTI